MKYSKHEILVWFEQENRKYRIKNPDVYEEIITDIKTHEIWDGEDRAVPQEKFDRPQLSACDGEMERGVPTL